MGFGYILVACFVYSIVINVVYRIKLHISSRETKLYSWLLKLNTIGIILEILCIILGKLSINSHVYEYLIHFYLAYIMVYMMLICLYMFAINITKDELYTKLKNGLLILTLISVLISFILKINVMDGYAIGQSVNFVYIYGTFTFILCFVAVFINRKNIPFRKVAPVFLLMFLIVSFSIIQNSHPEITIVTFAHFLVVFLMYFTIENPDVKLVERERNLKDAEIASSLAKSEFLASMSHELRTPLNAIIGLSEDIESFKDEVPVDVQEDSVDIVNAGNTLLDLIGNILDISKIESGKLEIVDTYYSPLEDFEGIAKLIRIRLGDKPIAFNVSLSPLLPKVLYGDKLRIKQIIMNILDNAVKYTDAGSIMFSANWIGENNALEIIVSDTGHGIKKELKDRIFGQFDRLEVEKVTSEEGSGLGLSITKNLVSLMNGTIKVDSEYRKGTVFRILIPQVIGSEEELAKLKEQATFGPIELDLSGKRLLIVDDNELNVKVLRKAIKNYHFEVDEAHNGQECLDKVNAGNTYDLILLDIMMPIMGGEETLKNLKAKEGFTTPVLALTADAMGGAKEKYMGMGFDDYLSKPFSRDQIAHKLNSVFSSKN